MKDLIIALLNYIKITKILGSFKQKDIFMKCYLKFFFLHCKL